MSRTKETPPGTRLSSACWKHLHARGENRHLLSAIRLNWETPPRTWRKLLLRYNFSPLARNTSTHVEKTRDGVGPRCGDGKHLHARGENSEKLRKSPVMIETPPRTWRKPPLVGLSRISTGNTSTHVEKTWKILAIASAREKHLHARGENFEQTWKHGFVQETPPRTWRKLGTTMVFGVLQRNTSTHVEKTDQL